MLAAQTPLGGAEACFPAHLNISIRRFGRRAQERGGGVNAVGRRLSRVATHMAIGKGVISREHPKKSSQRRKKQRKGGLHCQKCSKPLDRRASSNDSRKTQHSMLSGLIASEINKKSWGLNMARNFGLGSRDMSKAGQFALNNAVKDGGMSFDHAAKTGKSFAKFAEFAKENGVKDMQYVTPELVKEYGQQLADRVSNDEISNGHAQNLVSSVNATMREATAGRWKSVSSVKDSGINQRNNIRTTPPTGLDRTQVERGMNVLNARGQAIAQLGRELGLRTKESSLLNAQSALREAQQRGVVSISEGTKGGRDRQIPITSARQIQTLQQAALAQGNARAVMPPEKNWKQWKENGLRSIRETLQSSGISRLHDLRSSYACERYQALSGHRAPVLGGNAPKADDRAARLQIASELGHGRTDITNSYIGAHT